jgi:hypothetical protein
MVRTGTEGDVQTDHVPPAQEAVPESAPPAAGEPLSVPGVVALQGSIGNAAVARLLDRNGAAGRGRALGRQPHPAPAPPAAGPAVAIDPQTAAVEGMRIQLPGLINKAYQDYSNAVNSVRAEIVAKKVETPPPTDPMNVIMAVGMALVPWESIAITAVSTLVTGPARETLKAAVIRYFIEKNPLPFSPETREDKAIEALAAAAGLINDPDRLKTAYKGVAAGWQEVAKGAVVGSTELQQTLSFLDACIDEASSKTLSNLTGNLPDAQVTALWSAYSSPSLSLSFRGSVRAQAQHFADVLAKKPSDRGKSVSYYPLDAYGKRRWAKLRYNTTSANYFFLAWVPGDLEPVVAAANGGPGAEPLSPKLIANHLPDPVLEQERVVRMDAWGGLRMARVVGEEGVMHFRAWVPKSKYPETEAEAQNQIGGLETVPADSVHNKTAPAPGE